jgi:hypothetical protein
MGKIVVRFEGLCVLFTGNLNSSSPSMTVGLVEVSAETKTSLPNVPIRKSDHHRPKLTVNELQRDETGKLKRKPHSIWNDKKFVGDISFAAYPTDSTLSLFVDDSDVSLSKGLHEIDPQNAPIPASFQVITPAVDLYPAAGQLQAKSALCKARMHFQTGVLYASESESIEYGISDIKGKLQSGSVTKEADAAIKSGMEITIPDDGYALLYFSNYSPAVRFEGTKDYEVIATSLSTSSRKKDDRNHFLYYYSIFEPQPETLIGPVNVNQGETFSNPYCSVIGGGGE